MWSEQIKENQKKAVKQLKRQLLLNLLKISPEQTCGTTIDIIKLAWIYFIESK